MEDSNVDCPRGNDIADVRQSHTVRHAATCANMPLFYAIVLADFVRKVCIGLVYNWPRSMSNVYGEPMCLGKAIISIRREKFSILSTWIRLSVMFTCFSRNITFQKIKEIPFYL